MVEKGAADCGLAAPHTLEKVQSWAGTQGSVRRNATDPTAEMGERTVGHKGQGRG